VGAVPGALKAKFGASEVIVTIMLNFVVLALLNWIVASKMHVGESLHTPPINAGAVPRLSDVAAAFHGSAANATIIVAVVTCGGRRLVPLPHTRRVRPSRGWPPA
jgi:simple sugar transport system permease protein